MNGAVSWTDDHCHLHFDTRGDRSDMPVGAGPDEAVAEARAAGVTRMITVGCDVSDSRAAIGVAAEHDGVWATAGVHPHEASQGTEGLVDLFEDRRVVAVGECGLDYHYDHSPRDTQRRVFAEQIGLAHDTDLPLVIHTREAWADTFSILGTEGVPARTVFHCFTGGPDEAERCLALGTRLSISGVVTFPSAEDVRAAVALAPLERLLVETDSPFLAPVPHRGKANRPAWVPHVGAVVAELQGVTDQEVARRTRVAATELYGLPPDDA